MFHKFNKDGGKKWLPNEREKEEEAITIFLF